MEDNTALVAMIGGYVIRDEVSINVQMKLEQHPQMHESVAAPMLTLFLEPVTPQPTGCCQSAMHKPIHPSKARAFILLCHLYAQHLHKAYHSLHSILPIGWNKKLETHTHYCYFHEMDDEVEALAIEVAKDYTAAHAQAQDDDGSMFERVKMDLCTVFGAFVDATNPQAIFPLVLASEETKLGALKQDDKWSLHFFVSFKHRRYVNDLAGLAYAQAFACVPFHIAWKQIARID